MEIRKFTLTIHTQYDGSGFKQAGADQKKLAKGVDHLEKKLKKLDRALDKADDEADELGAGLDKTGRKADQAGGKLRQYMRRVAMSNRFVKKLSNGAAKLARKMGLATGKTARANSKLRRFGQAAEKAAGKAKKLGKDIQQLAPLAQGAGQALAALGASGVAVASGVLKVGTEVESLRAKLKTVTGSAGAAKEAFGDIQQFTATTPFQLQEITNAFVALRVRGLDGSNKAMTAYGDIAAALGKDLGETVQAVAQATVGEFESLKSLGISSKKNGDIVKFTFQGVTTTIQNNAVAIEEYLQSVGRSEKFAGAMADQAKTTAGAISNLKDSIFAWLSLVADSGPQEAFKRLIRTIAGGASEGESFAEMLGQYLTIAIDKVTNMIQKFTSEDVQGTLQAWGSAFNRLVNAIGAAVDAARWLTDTLGGTEEAMSVVTLAVIALSAAFMGPAGLVVAAGAAGMAIGKLVDKYSDISSKIADALEKIYGLQEGLEDLDATAQRIIKKRGAGTELEGGDIDPNAQPKTQDLSEVAANAERARLKAAGASDEVAEKFANKKRREVREAAAKVSGGRVGANGGALADTDGILALASSDTAPAELRQAAALALRTDENLDIGRDIQAMETSSARKAQAAGKKGKGKKKGVFFDFEKQVASEAKKRGEEYAAKELERLTREGLEFKDALQASREAGKARQAELAQMFREAGRVFDPNSEGILDILGLNGPDSAIANRPPPHTMVISWSMNVYLAETFEQNNSFSGTTPEQLQQLREATEAGGEELVEQSLEARLEYVAEMVDNMMALKVDAVRRMKGVSARKGGY